MRNAALLCVFLLSATVADAQVVCVGGRCPLPRARAIVAAPVQVIAAAPAVVAETVVVPTARVVREVVAAPVRIVTAPARATSCCSAQAHAEHLAATGIEIRGGQIAQRHHAGGVGREGLGFSTVSPQAAIERSCMYGRYPIREQATAWCPQRRGWIAVVRYH